MAANANCAVAIEIHSHHNEFKMHLLVECRVKFKSPFQKKKISHWNSEQPLAGPRIEGLTWKIHFQYVCIFHSPRPPWTDSIIYYYQQRKYFRTHNLISTNSYDTAVLGCMYFLFKFYRIRRQWHNLIYNFNKSRV